MDRIVEDLKHSNDEGNRLCTYSCSLVKDYI